MKSTFGRRTLVILTTALILVALPALLAHDQTNAFNDSCDDQAMNQLERSSSQMPSSSPKLVAVVDAPDNPDPRIPYPEYAANPTSSLSSSEKVAYYFRRVATPLTVIGPAFESALVIASPPKAYPKEWRQGASAFGQNYGSVMGRAQTGEFIRFAAGAAIQEDPRYFPSPIRTTTTRILYALGFTIVDRSDSGQPRIAFANFIGATAGGFVGDAWLPGDYTDLRHAGVRTGIELATFSLHNIGEEFSPELEKTKSRHEAASPFGEVKNGPFRTAKCPFLLCL